MKIYFENGKMLANLCKWDNITNYTEEDAIDFRDTLTVERYSIYSTDRVKLTSINSGRIYVMLISKFLDLIPKVCMYNGVISGTFGFTKQGTAQTLVYKGP